MRKYILTLFTFIFLIGCANSQSERELVNFTGDVKTDINHILSDSINVADIMDKITQSPRQIELTTKLQGAIRENYEWFAEYIKNVPAGQPMPYHSNLGISKEEYDELQILMNDVQIVASGQENLKISKADSLITFIGNGKLKPLNDVIIDLKNNKVLYKNYTLPFEKQVIIDGADNGFKSEWKGYNWTYEYPDDMEKVDLSDLENLEITQVKFTLGQLQKDGRIYLQLKERVVKNGMKIKDTQIPLLF